MVCWNMLDLVLDWWCGYILDRDMRPHYGVLTTTSSSCWNMLDSLALDWWRGYILDRDMLGSLVLDWW